MNIWNISIQNIKSKPLYTFLSIFILSLSVALLLGIQQIKRAFNNQIENNLGRIDLVVGAKGSPLQLVLASILHIDNPTGNMSYNEAKKIGESPMIESAVPISYGDNYKGFRIIGTTNKYRVLYNAEIRTGRTVEKPMEVVLGNTVAQKLDLKIGDTLLSSHGLVENNIDVHANKLTVVGILKPTKKVIDRLILTALESVWDIHNHDNEVGKENDHHLEDHHHDAHNKDKEITSLLINFKSPRALLTFPRKINKYTNFQAALPKYELNKLYEYTNIGFQTGSLIAYVILIISCVIICISLYNMVKTHAFDLAILRTYGASHFQLIKMLIYEGLILALTSFLLGFLLIKVLVYVMLHFMYSNNQQYIIQKLAFKDIAEIGVFILTMVVLSVSLAIYPIIKMNISTVLSNES